MPVTIRIPQPLQKLTQGQAEVAADGVKVVEVIASLEAKHPGIRERLLDENGKLRRFVNIYLNDEDIRFLHNLETEIKEGDKLSIVPAIAGGVSVGETTNVHKKFYLTFPQTLIKRPILWEMVKKFDVIPNIRTASVSNEIGLMALELEGSDADVIKAREWLTGLGVTVEPVEKNVIE